MSNLSPDILLRDSHSRHSPERSQIQPGYLSIDKYTSWQFPLILVYKTYTINKNSADIAGAVIAIPRCYEDIYVNSFFPRTARLRNFPTIECFPLTYDLNGCKSTLPYSRGRSTCYYDSLHDFSVTVPRCYKNVYRKSFFLRTARLWNSLHIECLSLTYNLKLRVKVIVWFFGGSFFKFFQFSCFSIFSLF